MSPALTQTLSPIIEAGNALSLDAFRALYFPSTISLPLPLLPSSKNPPNLALSPVPSSLTLSLESSSTLSPHDLQSCLDLIASTSASAYRASEQGWSPSKKRREMKLGDMKYFLLRTNPLPTPEPSTEEDDFTEPNLQKSSQNQQPSPSPSPSPPNLSQTPAIGMAIQGFTSFLLTHEDNISVIYIYELHLLPHLRGLGLGAHLMNLVENIGRSVGVEKAMLTCFVENVGARRFYEGKMGFGVDEFSPEAEGVEKEEEKKLRGGRVVKMRGKGYVILSKRLRDGEVALGEASLDTLLGGEGKGKAGGSVRREREREGVKRKRKRGESG